MMDERALTELVREIMAQGYDEETAGRYAVLVGDMPVRGEDGSLVVMEGGKEVARLKWPAALGGAEE